MNEQAYREKIKGIDHAIEWHTEELKAWQRVKVEAETAQGEAEEPKLRHGDYGIAPEGAWTRVHGSTWWNLRPSAGPSRQDADTFLPFWRGNIFKDLEALAKPLKQFEADDDHYAGGSWTSNEGSTHLKTTPCHGGLEMRFSWNNQGISFFISPENLPGFILDMQRVVLTDKEQNDT